MWSQFSLTLFLLLPKYLQRNSLIRGDNGFWIFLNKVMQLKGIKKRVFIQTFYFINRGMIIKLGQNSCQTYTGHCWQQFMYTDLQRTVTLNTWFAFVVMYLKMSCIFWNSSCTYSCPFLHMLTPLISLVGDIIGCTYNHQITVL